MVATSGRPPEIPAPPTHEALPPPAPDQPTPEPATPPVEPAPQAAQPLPDQLFESPPAGRPTAAGPAPRRAPNVVAAAILIGLGIALLVMQALPSGAWLFVALGAAFVVARAVTGQYGFAVPGGVLLGFGAFVGLSETGALPGDDGAWFFLLLGAGFLAVYLIGARWDLTWPFYPAGGLTLFAAFVAGVSGGLPAEQYAWLGAYWPVVLIGLGAWLLFRQALPKALATTADVLVWLAIIALTFLFLAVYLAPSRAAIGPVSIWPIGLPGLGPAISQRLELAAPIQPGETLTVANASGDTRIAVAPGGGVRVTALVVRRPGELAPEPALRPVSGGLRLAADGAPELVAPRWGHVDYEVQVPAGVRVAVDTASGDVSIAGVGAARVSTASGDVELRLAPGAADAGVSTASGDVDIWLDPAATASLSLRTVSGDLSAAGVPLVGARQDQRTLIGTLGAGAGQLTVETVSGDVRLRGDQ